MTNPENADTKKDVKDSRRECPKCHKKFDVAEYFIHLQEEILLKAVESTNLLNDIKEALLLSNQYMEESVEKDPLADLSDDDLKKLYGYDLKETEDNPEKLQYPETETESECTDEGLGI